MSGEIEYANIKCFFRKYTPCILLVSPTVDSCIMWYTQDKNKIELWKCPLSSTYYPSAELCRESLKPRVDLDLFFGDCRSSWEDPPDAVRTPLIYLQMHKPTVLRSLLNVSHHSSRAGITFRRTWAWPAAAIKLLLTHARGQKSWIHRLF